MIRLPQNPPMSLVDFWLAKNSESAICPIIFENIIALFANLHKHFHTQSIRSEGNLFKMTAKKGEIVRFWPEIQLIFIKKMRSTSNINYPKFKLMHRQYL